MANATGTATVNFGALPGACEGSVAVTGQAAISATSLVEAFVMADDSTIDHSASDHRWLQALGVSVTCGTPAAGTGFTIYVNSIFELAGQWKVRWVWSD